MTPRTVAGESGRFRLAARFSEPTGSPVATYRRMREFRTSRARSLRAARLIQVGDGGDTFPSTNYTPAGEGGSEKGAFRSRGNGWEPSALEVRNTAEGFSCRLASGGAKAFVALMVGEPKTFFRLGQERGNRRKMVLHERDLGPPLVSFFRS